MFQNERFQEDKVRDGNRGGHGLFSWNSVKTNKSKENYLGSSLKASKKDPIWYTKKKKKASKEINKKAKDALLKQLDLTEEEERVLLQGAHKREKAPL